VSTFKIIFQSEIIENQSLDTVKQRFAKQFKMTVEKADNFFQGKAVVLKKGLSNTDAEKWQAGLKKIGLITDIQPEQPQTIKLNVTPKRGSNKEASSNESKVINSSATLKLQPHGSDLLTDNEKLANEPSSINEISIDHLSAEISEYPEQQTTTQITPVDTSHLQAVSYEQLTEETIEKAPPIQTSHLSLID
jgi:transcription termination factor NusB